MSKNSVKTIDLYSHIGHYTNIQKTINRIKQEPNYGNVLITYLSDAALNGLKKPSYESTHGDYVKPEVIKTIAGLFYNSDTRRIFIEKRVFFCTEEDKNFRPEFNLAPITQHPPYIVMRWYHNLVLTTKKGEKIKIS